MQKAGEKQTKVFRRGLKSRVARLTGFSLQYVDQVLEGKRNNERIAKCAELVKTHEELSDAIILEQLKEEEAA